ncbi:MAG: metalloregulator ArsR/SmtB family transcription factor [Myxococcota bacterium]
MPASVSPVPVFAALGDRTRLELVSRLSDGQTRSIAQLCDGMTMTRQAVTKHLNVLRRAGIVAQRRVGRESHFQIVPAPLRDARDYLSRASAQWDDAISRLKTRVEAKARE